MKNKILSVALMAVAAICIICVPFAANNNDEDIPVVQPDVTQTTTVTTAPDISSAVVTDVTTETPEEVTDTTEQESTVSGTAAETSSEDETTAADEKTTTAVGEKPTTTAGGKTTTAAKKTTTTAKKTTTTAKKTTAAPKPVTTTKATTKAPATKPQTQAPAPKPESGTPVANHGQLSVKGANIVDKNGKVFQIRGMSTHGIMWEDFSNILSKESLKVLRDDWGCNTIRIAMYTEEWGGYTTGADFARQAKEKVNMGVANATDLGMYVIIDWHILNDNNPQTHQSEAIAFFTEMSQKYANYNNVLYEICNEPNGGTNWNSNVKPYADAVIPVIRKYDSDAIIICGTPNWSQYIDQADKNRLSDKNTVYALHFYADTHRDDLRNTLQQCYNNGLPILVSEFGTCHSSGNGGFNADQTQKWFTLLDGLNIGYLNWSACGKSETASAFKSGTNLSAIQPGEGQLTDSGKIVRKHLRERAGLQ